MVEPIDIRTGKPFVSRRCHEHHLPPSDGASLGGIRMAPSARARGLMGGAFMGCMMAQQSIPTPYHGYICDGLIAIWDGKTNLDTTAWRDEVSSREFSLTGTTVLGNGIHFAGDASSYATLIGDDIFNAIYTDTIEFAISFTSVPDNGRPGVVMKSSDRSLGLFNLGHYSVSSRAYTRSSWMERSGEWRDRVNTIIGISTSYGQNPSLMSYYNGGDAGTYGSDDVGGTQSGVTLGKRIGGVYEFSGTIHSIRLYSRALTASEVAANYAVDKARFGLP